VHARAKRAIELKGRRGDCRYKRVQKAAASQRVVSWQPYFLFQTCRRGGESQDGCQQCWLRCRLGPPQRAGVSGLPVQWWLLLPVLPARPARLRGAAQQPNAVQWWLCMPAAAGSSLPQRRPRRSSGARAPAATQTCTNLPGGPGGRSPKQF
jgi:hypothetical protein